VTLDIRTQVPLLAPADALATLVSVVVAAVSSAKADR
jgi:hypothetical protein